MGVGFQFQTPGPTNGGIAIGVPTGVSAITNTTNNPFAISNCKTSVTSFVIFFLLAGAATKTPSSFSNFQIATPTTLFGMPSSSTTAPNSQATPFPFGSTMNGTKTPYTSTTNVATVQIEENNPLKILENIQLSYDPTHPSCQFKVDIHLIIFYILCLFFLLACIL